MYCTVLKGFYEIDGAVQLTDRPIAKNLLHSDNVHIRRKK